MMLKTIFSIIIAIVLVSETRAQFVGSVKGNIIDSETKLPLNNVTISIESMGLFERTDSEGLFVINNIPIGNQSIQIFLEDYEMQLFTVHIDVNSQIDLGTIVLVFDLSTLETNNSLISLSDEELFDDFGHSENMAGMLQSTRDVFQNRAAFDFSQGFFRIRGYDSQNAQVLINGVSMNKLFNGRPQWNNWGGLNDATRNQELTMGLLPSSYSFGGILGTTNISTRASKYRSGYRISGSYSNRTYSGRAMMSYNSGLQKNGLAYSISSSRRWGNEGFIDGTLYDAFGFFGALEFKLNKHNSLNLTAMYTPNRRGGSAAITERVFNQFGRKYNPYWGKLEGKNRSSRIREIKEPLFNLSHFYETDKTAITTNFVYQYGSVSRSRLDYSKAPNPMPNYWRYLSYMNEKPQIDWNNLYGANTNSTNIVDAGAARYILYEDRSDDNLLIVNTTLNTKISDHITLDIGGTYKNLTSENYGKPIDLLGAQYYVDSNQFTLIEGIPSRNDALGEANKGINDRIKYNYDIISSQLNGFAQLQFSYKKADFFLTGTYTTNNHQRDGKFLNESYPDNSLGQSKIVVFNDFGFKGGLTYKITGRHLILLNGAYLSKAPTIRNTFVNSRENNNIVNDLESQKITSAEAHYIYRSPLIKLRFTGYLSGFKGGTDINFVFAQVGSGTDFFQEVVTSINKRHLGAELGLEYKAGSAVKAFLVAAYGKHTYSDDANVSINFDTAGFNDDLINEIGFKDLGKTNIKDLRVANGPQQAYSIGVEYRGAKNWWLSATANYLSHSYVDVSTIARTSDFYLNPEDPLGLPFEDIDVELANKLLEQEKFEGYYLLNLIAGKSWRLKGNYLSLFISINNAFEETFRTGGYEQSRTANYADLVEDTENGNNERSFGNKYWFGSGRSYFINLAYNF